MKQEIDIARVLCALEDLPDGGCRGFTAGEGDWPLRGLLVRVGDEVRGYVNRCPHAGHPLDLLPGRFLSPDGALILCSSHGALFDKLTGSCIAGPCTGRSLRAVPLRIVDGYVMLADDVDVTALAEDRL